MNKLLSIAEFDQSDQPQITGEAGLQSVGATTSQVAAQLKRRIFSGLYDFEERLPAERQLAEEFEVSRGTLRSALDLLERQKLVVRKMGSGTFVSYRKPDEQDEIANLTSPVEMIEVRIAIEPQMARLAIANASSRDLEALNHALLLCESCENDAEAFARADTAFHMALARCTRNKLMFWLYQRISEVRSNSQWQTMKNHLLTRQRIVDYNREHRAIYEAIISRDAQQAVKIIKSHLYGIHGDVNQSLETE